MTTVKTVVDRIHYLVDTIKYANKKYYTTQSAAWTCFYADINALRSIDFEDEQVWLDAHGYSALDDTADVCGRQVQRYTQAFPVQGFAEIPRRVRNSH